MAQDTRAAERAKAASNDVAGALVLLTHAITDPGPAAGPRAAAAMGPLNAAREHLIACAQLCAERQADDHANTALTLAEDCAARGRELTLGIVVLWPFVYAPLGAIYNAMIALGHRAASFAARVPAFVDLEPVTDSVSVAGPPPAANTPTWVPSEFPWPAQRQ